MSYGFPEVWCKKTWKEGIILGEGSGIEPTNSVKLKPRQNTTYQISIIFNFGGYTQQMNEKMERVFFIKIKKTT